MCKKIRSDLKFEIRFCRLNGPTEPVALRFIVDLLDGNIKLMTPAD